MKRSRRAGRRVRTAVEAAALRPTNSPQRRRERPRPPVDRSLTDKRNRLPTRALSLSPHRRRSQRDSVRSGESAPTPNGHQVEPNGSAARSSVDDWASRRRRRSEAAKKRRREQGGPAKAMGEGGFEF
uniref:Uncharacterized protein n=1 Tax=Plectus sambesii TaxID=2011161 RepID=A0A914V2L4_9BILA